MIKSCVTIALVPEIKQGPWIYWEDLAGSMRKAKALGFVAIEFFTASAGAVEPGTVRELMDETGLTIGAVGSGAGKVLHGLTLVDPDEAVRGKAKEFIGEMIDFGANFDAPVIIGSMQGVATPGQGRDEALDLLREGLEELGRRAADQGVKLIYEPLNRYETNLFNLCAEAAEFVTTLDSDAVVLLADLFHMNIEEADIAATIRENAGLIGHIHFADSNRRPVGCGHTEMKSIAEAIIASGYEGCVSAEAFPWPDPDAAAERTIESFRRYFGGA
jgi:sugar phosphate isomerase/epimerase